MNLRAIACGTLLALTTACGGGTEYSDTTETVPAPTTTIDPTEAAIADGNVAKCKDGGFSDNTSFRATCSSGGGVDRWLARYGECVDGTVIEMGPDATCDNQQGFKGLLPDDFVPEAGPDDVAKCKNGLYSDNTDFGATCSSGGGVDEWLAPYGECANGDIIKMSSEATCPDDDFKGLLPKDYEPQPETAGPNDVAQCNDGGFSDNTDFRATCSAGGGVAKWLAPYGECNDGTVITMEASASCVTHDGFKGLLPIDYVPTTTAPPTATELLTDAITKSLFFGEFRSIETQGATLVVTVRGDEGLTEGLTKDSGRRAVAEVLEGARNGGIPEGINEVYVIVLYDLVNQFGEVTEGEVIEAWYSLETINRIVFDNIDPTMILTLADNGLYVHPAFAKGDGS